MLSNTENLTYAMALSSVDGIGPRKARKLLKHFGDAKEIFQAKRQEIERIPGYSNNVFYALQKFDQFERIEQELQFLKKNNAKALIYNTPNYPKRLNHCPDGPIVLFVKGNADLNHERALAIVGTRNATQYGKDFVDQFVADLQPYGAAIYSGLAYGIDIRAHRAAIKNELSTVGVIAHGLDRVYPSQHKGTATTMIEKDGALVTEFTSGTNPDRENFPMRNRIIAGLVDAVLVVESKSSGGSIITAELANSYNRDVFAVPGRLEDINSEGCNKLIKANRAALIQSVKDIEYIMNWTITEPESQSKQVKLFIDLTPKEEQLINCLRAKGPLSRDQIALELNIPGNKLSTNLLNLELSGLIRAKPGNLYEVV